MAKQVKKWITINGNHVPVYEDGSLGGIGANLQQKKDDEWEDYDEQDKLEAIAERYGGSKPVSGSWDTEVEHEQNAIAEAFNISKEEAKQKMIDELGFTEDQFKDIDAKEGISVTGRQDPNDKANHKSGNHSLAKELREKHGLELESTDGNDIQNHPEKLDGKEVTLYDKDDNEYTGTFHYDKETGEKTVEGIKKAGEDFPFQSKGLSKEEKAEDWAKETQKDIAAKKANIKEMGYAEAGQFISDHKEEFGLSDDDDAYQIAAQIKNGDIKLDKDGKVSKADRDKVSEDLKAMDKAAKERGDYVEADDADITAEKVGKKGSKSLEDHPDIQKIAEDHVKKIWNGGAANRELYDAADKWAEEHNFDKTKAKDAAFAAMNKKQMAEIKRRESEEGSNTLTPNEFLSRDAKAYQEDPRIAMKEGWGKGYLQEVKNHIKNEKKKSIKIGDKEVKVKKDKSMDDIFENRTTTRGTTPGMINTMSSTALRTQLRKAGLSSADMKGKDTEELRRMLLAIYKKK